MVTEIISEKAPVIEKASIDEHYLDITGMDRFFGCYTWMHELRQRIINETGLPISFGLSVNKTVAKIATGEAKPNGEKDVPFPLVKPFLAPLSIARIPGVGDTTFRLLRSMERTSFLKRVGLSKAEITTIAVFIHSFSSNVKRPEWNDNLNHKLTNIKSYNYGTETNLDNFSNRTFIFYFL